MIATNKEMKDLRQGTSTSTSTNASSAAAFSGSLEARGQLPLSLVINMVTRQIYIQRRRNHTHLHKCYGERPAAAASLAYTHAPSSST